MSLSRRSSTRLTSNNKHMTNTKSTASFMIKTNRNNRSNQNDTITSLLQKLPPIYKNEIPDSLHGKVISKSRETLRLLNSKTSRGQSLCKGDSIETRSAVVLEYVLRQGLKLEDGSVTETVRVPLEVLGKFVGVQKKDIEKLAYTIGFYLKQMDSDIKVNNNNSSSIGSKKNVSFLTTKPRQVMDVHRRYAARINTLSSSTNSILHSQSNSAQKINNPEIKKTTKIRKSTSKIMTNKAIISHNHHEQQQQQQQNEQNLIQSLFLSSPQNNIHLLSIKLQSYLHDPSAIEHKSNNLWWNIIQYKVKNLSTRRAAIFDLQSHNSHYEGACFFYTVSDLELGSTMTGRCETTRSSNINKSSSSIHGNIHQKSKPKATKSNVSFKGNSDEDIEDNILTIEDVIHALRIDADSFSKIFEEVSILAAKMGEQKYVNTSGILSMRATKRARHDEVEIEQFSSNDNDQDARETLNNKKSKLNEGFDVGDGGASFNSSKADFESVSISFKPKYIAKNQFMEWKDKVIRSITSSHDTSLSKQCQMDMLRKSADIILEKYKDQNIN